MLSDRVQCVGCGQCLGQVWFGTRRAAWMRYIDSDFWCSLCYEEGAAPHA